MKSDSQRMNELAHKSSFLREISESEATLMRKVMLDIFRSVINLCKQENLTYMMSGGTCLGAVRHKGFIPWDDDLDIMMPRHDYQKLIQLCEDGRLGTDYEFSYPNKRSDANNVFLKVFRKETLNVELANIGTPFPKGIFIDVFPIDSIPKNKALCRIKGLIANGLQFISICTLYAQFPSNQLKAFMKQDPVLSSRYRIKVFIGCIFSFIPHKRWIYWFDKFVSSSIDSQLWGIPTGRKYYNGEIFDRSVFIPVREGIFEGISVCLPNETDTYLKNLYQDYMQIPPKEKRERHFIYKFEVSNIIKLY